jgi:hypothetical protein
MLISLAQVVISPVYPNERRLRRVACKKWIPRESVPSNGVFLGTVSREQSLRNGLLGTVCF